MLSQEAMTGGATRQTVCLHMHVCERGCTALADGVPSPQGGKDKQSVWAEIRWEQTLVRLTDCK